jgi:hypothetical protein
MMEPFRHTAAAILLIAGCGTAGAQTVITTQPAETVAQSVDAPSNAPKLELEQRWP